MKYKAIKTKTKDNPKSSDIIVDSVQNCAIPEDINNKDYAAYLEWCKENTPSIEYPVDKK